MCDTMVALQNATVDGSIIFEKNSYRESNEPHIGVYV
ncbi:dipeptidase-like protein [Thermosipho africanus H17ap60334]|jgi:dipeptidase|nr:dipeptidase-like protein [Thermosipho africanus H17ap60334]RDI91138.1 dipeptidase-like protein [Thermosipho africanus Ob7]